MFAHDIKIFEGYIKLSGVFDHDTMVKHSRAFLIYNLRTTVPFVTAHLEILHRTHHPVIPESDLYFTFCSTLNALSKRTPK